LAADVGGLKNVLTNVKTKGILGEYQLAAILEEILSKEQYEENIATKSGSADRVEFAIKLPGGGDDGGAPVYLPIDAKFPSTLYEQLTAAYELGNKTLIEEARKALATSAKQSARTIHDKYIDPPHTTDFAVMFLPTEGLYAEVVNLGLIEDLQRLYKIVIAGPSTMVATLNSFQMGFKTLAIQKRSSEVWNVLGGVKTEFEKFGGVLEKARTKLQQADTELDSLIGTRTNAINRKLRNVTALKEPDETEKALLLDELDVEDTSDGFGIGDASDGFAAEDTDDGFAVENAFDRYAVEDTPDRFGAGNTSRVLGEESISEQFAAGGISNNFDIEEISDEFEVEDTSDE
ncbi:MAG: DNA recombination protein RmuC, partial [Clostridiales Family XIII bacterium]|nr:DNA recombination protein RmuC [Clostridiales Family XIII bacterium]